jgi:hypothetical protein
MSLGETIVPEGNQGEEMREVRKVPLESLSEMTGFPVDFIKKELLLESKELSMADLRKSMMDYLENAHKSLNS